MKIATALLPMFIAASGCAHSPSEYPLANLQPLPPELAAVEKECDIRAPFFRFTSSGDVLMMPDLAEKYEAVDCAIAALKRPELAKYADRLGFIGNEAFANEEQE